MNSVAAAGTPKDPSVCPGATILRVMATRWRGTLHRQMQVSQARRQELRTLWELALLAPEESLGEMQSLLCRTTLMHVTEGGRYS